MFSVFIGGLAEDGNSDVPYIM